MGKEKSNFVTDYGVIPFEIVSHRIQCNEEAALATQETVQVDDWRRHRLPSHSTAKISLRNKASSTWPLLITAEMDQDKPRKVEAIKYGDVFDISGELAAKPITPKDAAAMQLAENRILGENPKSGMATVMKSAAELNERRGLVQHDDTTDVVRDSGTEISETTIAGHRLICESIGGHVRLSLSLF